VPSGRKLLERIDKSRPDGYVFVKPQFGENDHGDAGDSAQIRYDRTDHRWTDNPTDWQRAPNVIGLFHELVHSLQFSEKRAPKGKTGGTKNVELDAVGLPYDHDGKRSTPPRQPSADNPTENQFREDLEYEKRTKY
jgi:hypothetical protein